MFATRSANSPASFSTVQPASTACRQVISSTSPRWVTAWRATASSVEFRVDRLAEAGGEGLVQAQPGPLAASGVRRLAVVAAVGRLGADAVILALGITRLGGRRPGHRLPAGHLGAVPVVVPMAVLAPASGLALLIDPLV
jgi:hypothetical protein